MVSIRRVGMAIGGGSLNGQTFGGKVTQVIKVTFTTCMGTRFKPCRRPKQRTEMEQVDFVKLREPMLARLRQEQLSLRQLGENLDIPVQTLVDILRDKTQVLLARDIVVLLRWLGLTTF